MLTFAPDAAPMLGAVYQCQGDILTEEVKEFKDEAIKLHSGICNLSDVKLSGYITNSNNTINTINSFPSRMVVNNPNAKNTFYFSESFDAATWCGHKSNDVVIVNDSIYRNINGELRLLTNDATLDDSLCNIEWHEEEMERAYDEGKTDGYHEGYEEGIETVKRDKKNGFISDDGESFIETLEREADAGTLSLHKRDIISWTNPRTGLSVICIADGSAPFRTYFVPSSDHYDLFKGGFGIVKSEMSINDIVINNKGESLYWIKGINGSKEPWLCSISDKEE